jgi:hypothetical protein
MLVKAECSCGNAAMSAKARLCSMIHLSRGDGSVGRAGSVVSGAVLREDMLPAALCHTPSGRFGCHSEPALWPARAFYSYDELYCDIIMRCSSRFSV